MQTGIFKSLVVMAVLLVGPAPFVYGQTETPKAPEQKTVPPGKQPDEAKREGTMTIQKMDEIIKLLDARAKSPRAGVWQFTVEKNTVIIVTDTQANRMRIMVPIRPAEGLTAEEFKGIGQTVNLAATYGTTFNSGLLSYGGGDSRSIIRRQLIDKLLKQGIPI